MTKFLFTTLPSNDLGLLTRSLPIAEELKNAGHQIAFSSPSKAPDRLIKAAGFENLIPLHPLYQIKKIRHLGLLGFLKTDTCRKEYGNAFNFFFNIIRAIPTRFAPPTTQIWNMDHAAAIAGMLNKNFVRANCEAYQRMIREYDADFVVDFWNPFACIAAKALHKPLITVIQADGHPNNNGLIWWKKHPKNLPTALPVINQIRSEYGQRAITKMEELNVGDLTLVIGMPESDPIAGDPNCIYVGPILWENPADALPGWVNHIDKRKPLIWVYPGNPRYRKKGTVLDSEIIIQACIKAFGKEDLRVILTTGHHKLPEQLLPLPHNFYLANYLPGLKMAEMCDLMIHHGGYGSCQTGLYTGTPAVMIPTFSERESNARRVTALGAGEFVLPETNASYQKTIDFDEFEHKVNQVLTIPAYAENAQRCSRKLRVMGGPLKAAKIILDFTESININTHQNLPKV